MKLLPLRENIKQVRVLILRGNIVACVSSISNTFLAFPPPLFSTANTPALPKGRRSIDSDVTRFSSVSIENIRISYVYNFLNLGFDFCRLGLPKPPHGHMKLMGDFSDSESEFSFISASQQESSDLSFISSGRPSVDRSSFTYDLPESARTSRMSTSSEQSIGSHRLGIKFTDLSYLNGSSSVSDESGRTSCSFSSQSLV